jgi:hypothetical protein
MGHAGNIENEETIMSASKTTTDHRKIRQWAEERDGKPTAVRGTSVDDDTGILRIDFPGYTGGDSLREISWDEFFATFERKRLALLYQEETPGGAISNFNKLVAREES